MKKSEKIILGVAIGFWTIIILTLISTAIIFISIIKNGLEQRREQYDNLERIVYTNMPDEMMIDDGHFLKKRLSTEYTVIGAEGETLILRNHEVKAIWGAVSNLILTDLNGNQINDDYRQNISYGDYYPVYRSSMVTDRLAVISWYDTEGKYVQAYSIYGEEIFDGTKQAFENMYTEAAVINESDYETIDDEDYSKAAEVINGYYFLEDYDGNMYIADVNNNITHGLPVFTEDYDVDVYNGIIVFGDNDGISTVYSVEVK